MKKSHSKDNSRSSSRDASVATAVLGISNVTISVAVPMASQRSASASSSGPGTPTESPVQISVTSRGMSVTSQETVSSPKSDTLANVSSTPKSKPSTKSSGSGSQNGPTVPSDIFCDDTFKVWQDTVLPVVGERVETTAQLVACVKLLTRSTIEASGVSLARKNASGGSLDPSRLKWIQEMNERPLEKDHLHKLMKSMVDRFLVLPNKTPDAIHEIVLLGPVLQKVEYRALLNRFLSELKTQVILDTFLLQGLVRLVECAPPLYLRADDLTKILRNIRDHLTDSAQQETEYTIHLTVAISKVLVIMVACEVKDLHREQEHKPLLEALSKLRKHEDPLVRYQVEYAYRALQLVPDDETVGQGLARNALSFAGGLMTIASVIQLDFGGVPDGLPVLIESGRGLADCMKKYFGPGDKNSWFRTICRATAMVNEGRLVDFNHLINEADCRQDPFFRWGICQILDEMAVDPSWAVTTRESAVRLLGEMFKTTSTSGQHRDVRRCILTLLQDISDLPSADELTGTSNTAVKLQALILVSGFDGTRDERAFSLPYARAAINYRPSPTLSFLLKEAGSTLDLDLELVLDRLRWHRRMAYSRHAVYIPAMSKSSLHASDDSPDLLHDQVHQFLKGKGLVMLILGDSGAGKSTFNARLEQDLWDKYTVSGPIPLFIDLKVIRHLDQDLVRQHLESLELFSASHMAELRTRQFILICDGYDESQSRSNLHTNSKLNMPNHWRAKMVISCRTQYLTPGYQSYFAPRPNGLAITGLTPTELYREAVVVPFQFNEIKDYIEQYTKSSAINDNKAGWSTEHYMERLHMIAHIMDLIKNPFMLKIVLEVLPKMDPVTTKITRAELYDEFVELHFDKELNRLIEQRSRGKMASERLSEFQEIEGPNFIEYGINFSKRLAHEIFKEENGVNSVEYCSVEHKKSWKREFFGPDAITQLLLESSQLVSCSGAKGTQGTARSRGRSGSSKTAFRFSHLSILEYFYALSIYDPRDDVPQLPSTGTEASSTASPYPKDHPLGQRNLVSKPSILQFLADRVQHAAEFKDHLYDLLRWSCVDPSASCAAANAITILVQAGERFNGADLRGIRVPGADLTGGEFDSAELQGADLRNAVLRNVWLRQADLSNSRMEGVTFGESPHLQENAAVEDCVFSPDGSHLVAGFRDNTIAVLDTSTWSRVIFEGHTDRVTRVTYSPGGQQVASASQDTTVRLWDVQTGTLSSTLNGHDGTVNSVAFSPSGQQVVTGGNDKTVRLWDTRTGAPGLVLTGHTHYVTAVTYSSSGHQIASGCWDGEVRLWDTQTGAHSMTLSGSTSPVHCVAYSPNGQQIASCGPDYTISLWDAQTGTSGVTLSGHTDVITSVSYSPNGQHIASSSWDTTVRLWDTQTGTLSSVFSGHSNWVYSVSFSPTGQQIASGSLDKTLRLWDASAGTLGSVKSGNTGVVYSVAYSPDGQQIATGGQDRNVRLLDAQTGALKFSLSGHTEDLTSVAYSTSGKQVVSGCEDFTMRLWDAQTGALCSVLSGHTDAVMDVAFSPDEKQIASGGYDNVVRLWDARTGVQCSVLSGHTKAVLSVAYSPSGHQIASGCQDKTVRLWDVQTGTPGLVLEGHSRSVNCVAYAPCGQRIASCSQDKTIRLWDALTGDLIVVLNDHTHNISSVAYSPSGQHLASVGWDMTVRLWDTESNRCVLTVDSFEDNINSVAWGSTPDGTYLVTGCREQSVRSWKVVGEKGDVKARLHWRASPDTLVLSKASIQGVEDLDETNMWLLQQKQVVGSNRAVSL
ncbi:hypothetical protein EMPS_01416 [Entomortierella parvispora]|uniref:NACHT domain-containing protein n=1 Tax=Entomortierella parvispora TaxID=205924 RepID=A0A9P3LSX8_9FUNG|nr:hypothetical protein EMPS_01416 [Entomortierella parvispora]